MWKRLRLAAWYWSFKRRGHRVDRALTAKSIDRIIGFLERYLEITPDQQESWGRFATTMRDGAEAFRGAAGDPADRPADAITAVARLDAKMEAGLIVLRRVRPAFEQLHGTLTETQRRTLDEAIATGTHGDGPWSNTGRVPPALWPLRHRYYRAAGC